MSFFFADRLLMNATLNPGISTCLTYFTAALIKSYLFLIAIPVNVFSLFASYCVLMRNSYEGLILFFLPEQNKCSVLSFMNFLFCYG